MKKTSGTAASSYIPDYPGGIYNDLVTQTADVGTINAVYGQGYGRVSQRFMPEAGAEAADTYFQHDLYGSTLFAADAQGVIRHHAAHDIWGVPKTVCDDGSMRQGSALRLMIMTPYWRSTLPMRECTTRHWEGCSVLTR